MLVVEMTNYERDLKHENRVLRYLLTETIHELGRAVAIPQAAIALEVPHPKPMSILVNPVSLEWVVAPR
jgi:hypothetical protein